MIKLIPSVLKSLVATVFFLANTALLAGPGLVERTDYSDLEYGSSSMTLEGLLRTGFAAAIAYFFAWLITAPFEQRLRYYTWFAFLRVVIFFVFLVVFGVLLSNKKVIGTIFIIGIAYFAWVFFFRKEAANKEIESDRSSESVGNKSKCETKDIIEPKDRRFRVVEKVVPKGSDSANPKHHENIQTNRKQDPTLSNISDRLKETIVTLEGLGWNVEFDGIRWKFFNGTTTLYSYTKADVIMFLNSLKANSRLRCPTCGSDVHGSRCERC